MLPKSLQRLINSFSRLPGIGPKTAERLAFFMLKESDENINYFASAIQEFKKNLKFCKICFNIDEEEICKICNNKNRNQNIICIIENPLDLIAIEKSEFYNGVYHVLNGVLSPIDGIGPKNIKIDELINRVKNNKNIEELIMALNPNMEGEATCSYIKNQIKQLGIEIKISRIAKGLPTGSNIEYADNLTLENALQGRQEMI
jgi:recombination protein RecR